MRAADPQTPLPPRQIDQYLDDETGRILNSTPGGDSTRVRGAMPQVCCARTEHRHRASVSPFGPHEMSALIGLTSVRLRYLLTDVPRQPNSPPDYVLRATQ